MKLLSLICCVFLLITGCKNNQVSSSKDEIYTKNGTRLRLVSETPGDINLMLVPGGAGMDSLYMMDLVKLLNIKGKIWFVDLPDNGTNERKDVDFSKWHETLFEALDGFDNIVLAGHSFSGALILKEPRLDNKVKGFIMLNSAPTNPFNAAQHEQKKYKLIDLNTLITQYKKAPTNENVKKSAIAAADYYFLKSSKEKGIKILSNTIYNHRAFDYAINVFWNDYKLGFIPSKPTLVIGGEFDHITPFYLWTRDTKFKKNNIKLVKIKNAGHFSWIEKPEETKKIIENFVNSL